MISSFRQNVCLRFRLNSVSKLKQSYPKHWHIIRYDGNHVFDQCLLKNLDTSLKFNNVSRHETAACDLTSWCLYFTWYLRFPFLRLRHFRLTWQIYTAWAISRLALQVRRRNGEGKSDIMIHWATMTGIQTQSRQRCNDVLYPQSNNNQADVSAFWSSYNLRRGIRKVELAKCPVALS